MTIPDFSSIPFRGDDTPAAATDKAAAPSGVWETPEGISVKRVYTKQDRDELTLLRGDLDASTGTAALAALHAQYLHVYDALEDTIGAHANSEFLAPLHDARLERTASLRADLDALSAAGVEFEREPHAPTQAYVAELRELGASDSREAAASLAGHHYVRYLGDLSGGQVVSRLVSRAYSIPAESLSFYSFDIEKPKVFKDSYRAALRRAATERRR